MVTFKQYHLTEAALDKFQAALDIAGIAPDPLIGTTADGMNALISTLRAASAKTGDDRKKHLINAGISAISVIPMADVIKVLKLRHLSKPLTRLAIKGTRYGRDIQKLHKAGALKALKAGFRVTRAADRIVSTAD